MASLGSLSFLVETTMENSVLVGGRSKPYRKFSLVGFDRNDSLDSGLSGSNFVFLRLTDGVIVTNCPLDGKKLVEGRNRVSRRHTKGLRATGRNNLKEENDDETDAALQETIEKSKKVLAMQNNLLKQLSLFPTIWSLWWERNNRLFKDKSESNTAVGHCALAKFASWAVSVKVFRNISMSDILRAWKECVYLA